MTLPSGGQHTIRHGEQTAVITEVGAGLRSYTVGSRPVIDGYPPEDMCTGARGHSLIPWPNRVRDGRYTWDGTAHQLDLTDPGKHGAIHGLTRWAPWQYVGGSEATASLSYVLHACPGWSWVLECRLDYSLDSQGLTVRTVVTNASDAPCPYGTGAHPYITVGRATIDTASCQVPADVYFPVDELGIPTGQSPVDGTPYDLRRGQRLGDRRIDTAYTQLHLDADGRARVRLSDPDGTTTTLWADEAYPYLEIYTGDTLPEADRRRTGLAVEPMTCVPDAFNSRTGLTVLRPGQTHRARWGIEPFPPSG
ncbi:aldose 1-epimerase family protein [Streptomyces sp. NPDC098781]|uniref:aldose 1-epimerase family protein n=1 Tax=Streptomyces sp. NPDC098781 TaxID=3366097 RepID=UPI0038286C7B